MRNVFVAALLSVASVWPPMVGGADGPQESLRRFGPYLAVTFDESVLQDVKVEANGDVFLMLQPDHREKELVVKISDQSFARYRTWWHGGYDLVSPANQGKPPNAWTDYVNTAARYIEYWMDGEVFLHLKRSD